MSELAAIERRSLQFLNDKIVMAVKPGFIYKNQRLGRSPPNIIILKCPVKVLCPVESIKEYLNTSSNQSGTLFKNTRSGADLKASAISFILVKLIKEAMPLAFPHSHDIRKVASSLAWVRGVSPEEIAKRGFWASSSTFISCYLIPNNVDCGCVAFNSII